MGLSIKNIYIQWTLILLHVTLVISEFKSSSFQALERRGLHQGIISNVSLGTNVVSPAIECALSCTEHDTDCHAFEICLAQGIAYCATLKDIDIENSIASTCKAYKKIPACTNGALWNQSSWRCDCPTNWCGDVCNEVCEGPCPSGWNRTSSPEQCWKFYSFRATYSYANHTCRQGNGRLLMMHTQERYDFWNPILEMFDWTTYGYWIGGDDLQGMGWMWSDGSLFADHTFVKWGRRYQGGWVNQPDYYLGKDHCVRLDRFEAVPANPTYDETSYTFHDDVCEETILPFFCEIPV